MAFLHELIENFLGLGWFAHADISDSETGAGEMPDTLRFGIKVDRFRKVSIFPVGRGKIRIEIEIIWIELQRSLSFDDGIVDSVVGQIRGGGDVTDNRGNRV